MPGDQAISKKINKPFVLDLILAEGVRQGPTPDLFFLCSRDVRDQIQVNTQELLCRLGESEVNKLSQSDGSQPRVLSCLR